MENLYRKDENSFDFLSDERGDVSILVNYLQISVKASNNNLLSIWGLHPYRLWKFADLTIPQFLKGYVKCLDNYESGISYRDKDFENWNTYYDKNNGWVCIGDKDIMYDAIMFATNSAVVIKNNKIMSIWIKPQIV